MKLPINFPDNAKAIAEEVARFRALSPDAQVRELGEMVRLYHFLADHSFQPEVVSRLAQEDEDRGRKAIEEFAARHG